MIGEHIHWIFQAISFSFREEQKEDRFRDLSLAHLSVIKNDTLQELLQIIDHDLFYDSSLNFMVNWSTNQLAPKSQFQTD